MPIVLAEQPPNPYTQAVDVINRLGDLMSDARAALGLTLTQQAAQVGISASTLANLGPGTNSTETTIVKSLTWLGANL